MKHLILTPLAIAAVLALPTFAATTKMSSAKSGNPRSTSTTQSKSMEVQKVPAKQEAAQKLAKDLTSTQETKLLTFLNEASVKELTVVRGISTRRGDAIEKARPFKTVDEVILVAGIGESTFAQLVKHGKTLTRSRSTSKTSKPS
ncbi:MAG: helix-hairpin-helix domain-containing protein [Verrucomicrobiae bacterium]|nr:helix-hairpin-helix domain-containing protein [Verrucomicrobiae bacterium]